MLRRMGVVELDVPGSQEAQSHTLGHGLRRFKRPEFMMIRSPKPCGPLATKRHQRGCRLTRGMVACLLHICLIAYRTPRESLIGYFTNSHTPPSCRRNDICTDRLCSGRPYLSTQATFQSPLPFLFKMRSRVTLPFCFRFCYSLLCSFAQADR